MRFIDKIRQNKRLSLIKEKINKDLLRQMRRYLIIGLLSAGTEYIILYCLTNYKSIWYVSSNTIALTVGFWISFLMNKFWSFNSRRGILRQLLLYGILFAFNLVVSNTIIFLLTEKMGLYYMLSKLFATGVIVLWNFIIYKKIIYK